MTTSNPSFKITYCGTWGYRQRAARLAAELESHLDADTNLIRSSGGVFEVEYNGTLIYSKKAAGRFPADEEVLKIVHGVDTGLTLAEAQEKAAEGIPPTPSFFDWLKRQFTRRIVQN